MARNRDLSALINTVSADGTTGKFTVDPTTGQIEAVINSTVGTDYQSTLYDGYLCRAWVRVTITSGVPSVNTSGNVSSVTDNNVGIMTLNFTNSMPDANYSITGATLYAPSSTNARAIISSNSTVPPATASLQINTTRCDTNANVDVIAAYIHVFR